MGLIERLRRPDWLWELQCLSVVIGVVAAAVAALRVVRLVSGADGVPVDLLARSLDGTAGAHPEAGVTVPGEGTVEALVADPSGSQITLSTLTWLPTVVLVIAVLTLVFRLLRDARRSDPFTRRTVRRLRILAIVALVGGEAVAITESLCGLSLVDSVLPDPGGFYGVLNLPIGWVFVGFAFLAVGELINRGRALRDELAGVI